MRGERCEQQDTAPPCLCMTSSCRNRHHHDSAFKRFHELRAFAPLCIFMLAGCAGSGEVNLVSLEANAIDPPGPTVYRYDAQECYWWTSETHELDIALHCERGTFLGLAGTASLELSFVLPNEPAGTAKDYRIGRREIRGAFNFGLENHRFSSYQGIVGVVSKNKTLEGSYRLWLLHQPGSGLFNLFPRQPGQLLVFGRFTAKPDDKGLGRQILANTESGGWERTPKTATAPAMVGAK